MLASSLQITSRIRSALLPSHVFGMRPSRFDSSCCRAALRMPLGAGAGENICAHFDRDGPFSILANRDAGHSEARCFLLDAAGVGDDDRSVLHQAEEIEIAERVNQADAPLRLESAAGFGAIASCR